MQTYWLLWWHDDSNYISGCVNTWHLEPKWIYIFHTYLSQLYDIYLGFPGGSVIKNLSTNAGEVKDASLISGTGRSLEEKMATHSSILARIILWTEEPVRYCPWLQSWHDWATTHACMSISGTPWTSYLHRAISFCLWPFIYDFECGQ